MGREKNISNLHARYGLSDDVAKMAQRQVPEQVFARIAGSYLVDAEAWAPKRHGLFQECLRLASNVRTQQHKCS